MTRISQIFLLILVLPFSAVAGDETIGFSDDDPEMNAAMETARLYLDQFLDSFADYDGDGSAYGVKVAMPVGDEASDDYSVEVIWVSPFRVLSDGSFVGFLANEPNYLPGLSFGSKVSFARNMIADWYIDVDGKVYGYYTIRVLLPYLDEQTQASVEASMYDGPLPPFFTPLEP